MSHLRKGRWSQAGCALVRQAVYRCYSTSTSHSSESIPPYKHAEIESKWITHWNSMNQPKQGSTATRTDPSAPAKYILCMFPYPSGNLHMGHLRVYTIGDVLARFERMRSPEGTVVINPMGWDAFGLPAENAAIDRGVDPAAWTQSNIETMRKQLIAMGTSFDWDKEVTTCDPSYYKWTQYLFLRMYKAGLVYRKSSIVNWDPVDQTVLANEQVDDQGRAERSGAVVEKRDLEQWFIRLTEYADELLEDLKDLDWPENVKQLQTNWIGRTVHTVTRCTLVYPKRRKDYPPLPILEKQLKIHVVDDGVKKAVNTVCIPINHPMVDEIVQVSPKREGLQNFVDETRAVQKSENIDPQVLLKSRDTGFVTSHPNYGRFRVTIGAAPSKSKSKTPCAKLRFVKKSLWSREIRSGPNGEPAGRRVLQFKVHDWLISRQRYWGTPIPMIHCDSCGHVPVPEEDLPVVLPKDVVLSGRGMSPLKNMEEWVKCKCPKCNGDARRETDTMDTFVDSSWYWLRYLDAQNAKDIEKSSHTLPVDTYVGGVEHSILHLLYARFIGKFIWKDGLATGEKFKEARGEPFKSLLAQGMVQGRTFKCPESGRYLRPDELEWKNKESVVIKGTEIAPTTSYEKMSKSKHNGVDPLEVISKYGSDVTRLSILYKCPPNEELLWHEDGTIGMSRWLNKCWKLVHVAANLKDTDLTARDIDIDFAFNSTIIEVTHALEKSRAFNVAIASLIKLSNILDTDATPRPTKSFVEAVDTLVRLLFPFAPCASAEMSSILLKSESPQWPFADQTALVRKTKSVVLMVNGKFRGAFNVASDIDAKALEEFALQTDIAKKWVFSDDGTPLYKKVLVLKNGGVVNVVLKNPE